MRLEGQGLGDLDDVAEMKRVPTRTVGIDRAELGEGLAGPGVEVGIVHEPFPAGVDLRHEDVLGHRDVGAEEDLLVDEADAESVGGAGEAISTGTPFRRISPLSGRRIPSMMFISVDLPAPFSPAMAWTSPRRSSKSTPRSAWMAPNDLLTWKSEDDLVGHTVELRGRVRRRVAANLVAVP